MSKVSVRIHSGNRISLRTDRGRQGEVGPAGYAVPIDGKTILANPLNSEASPVAIPVEEARSLIGAISAPDMQAAIDEFLDEIDGGYPDTEYSHDEIDGGEPW